MTTVSYVDIGHVFLFILSLYVLALLGVAFIFVQLLDVSCQYLPMVPPLCYLASDDYEEGEEADQQSLMNDRWQVVHSNPRGDEDDDLTCTSTSSEASFDENEYEQFWKEMEELEKDHMDFMAMQQFLDMETMVECPVMFAP